MLPLSLPLPLLYYFVSAAAGGATGFAIGGYRTINLPSDPAFNTLKLKTNRLINTSGAACCCCCCSSSVHKKTHACQWLGLLEEEPSSQAACASVGCMCEWCAVECTRLLR
jgi:hypothetical protein